MMSRDHPDKVHVKGKAHVERIDSQAGADLEPGQLVEKSDVLEAGTQNYTPVYVPHGTDGGRADPVFVRKRGEMGETYDDVIPSGEYVQCLFAAPSNGIYAHLAAGETVTAGDDLVSAGNGALRARDTDGTAPDDAGGVVVATADEDVDNSGGTDAVGIYIEVAN